MKLNFSLTSPVKLVSTSTARTSGKTLNKSNAPKTAVSKAVKGLVSTSSNNTFDKNRVNFFYYMGKEKYKVKGGTFGDWLDQDDMDENNDIEYGMQLLDDGRAYLVGLTGDLAVTNRYKTLITEWDYAKLVRDSTPLTGDEDGDGADLEDGHDDHMAEIVEDLKSESSSLKANTRIFGKSDEHNANFHWKWKTKEGQVFKKDDLFEIWLTSAVGTNHRFYVRQGTKTPREISKHTYLELLIFSMPKDGYHSSVRMPSGKFNFKPNMAKRAD